MARIYPQEVQLSFKIIDQLRANDMTVVLHPDELAETLQGTLIALAHCVDYIRRQDAH